jgi:hypothetical protein
MEYQCDAYPITVETLYGYYSNGCLVKARIQRKKRWVDFNGGRGCKKTNNLDFIQFIIKTGHTVNPLLFVERIDGSRKVNIIIDGNNRINAIIHFIEHPLYYYNHLIPNEFTSDMKASLRSMTLRAIYDCRDLRYFCKEHDYMDFYSKHADDDNLYTAFDIMKGTLYKFRFFDIKALIIKFENITEDKIKEIYEGVNCGGIKLTRQEILASTTSLIKFCPEEINYFPQILHHVRAYYDDMDDKDKILIEREQDTLNLFEVLLGFQEFCADKYSFIDNTGECELDIMFRCYEVLFGDFEGKRDGINTFFTNIILCCNVINDIQSSFYNTNINYQCIEKVKLHLKKNNLTMLLIHLYTNIHLINDKEFICSCKRIVLYNELCNFIKEPNERKMFEVTNGLCCIAARNILETCKNIKKCKRQLYAPDKNDLLALLNYVNNKHITPYTYQNKPKRRGKLTKYKVLMLCIYYNYNIPLDFVSLPKNIEHIAPWSITRWTEGKQIDLDRLGNIILIDEKTNKKRGNKQLTSSFIESNKLYYYNFPTENEYMQLAITHDNILKNSAAYLKMCMEREQKYIESIINSLF